MIWDNLKWHVCILYVTKAKLHFSGKIKQKFVLLETINSLSSS